MKINAAIRKCLECGSALYDNRADKASGKRKKAFPDFKCKNDGEHVFWLDPKKGTPPPPDALADDEPRDNPPSSRPSQPQAPTITYTWKELAQAHLACLGIVERQRGEWPPEATAIAAQGLLAQAIALGLKNPRPERSDPTGPARDPAPAGKPVAARGLDGWPEGRQGHPAPAPVHGDPEYGGAPPSRPEHRYRGRAVSSPVPAGRAPDLPEDLAPDDGRDDDLPF